MSPGFGGCQGAGRSKAAAGLASAAVCGAVAEVRRNHFPIAAKPSGNNRPLASAAIKHVFSVKLCCECFMSSSFHSADRRTYRKVMLVGLLFCAAFVVVSFLAREQPENTYVLKKADRLVRSAGSAVPAN